MAKRFEELDWQPTAWGEISLRRRRDPALDVDVFEVLLGDEYLMSSLFTVAEEELARLGLAALAEPDGVDVVVGGLGLGCTARAALEDGRVRSLHVVEALAEVIGWHERALLPAAEELTGDPRCRLVQGDFFALAGEPSTWAERLPEPVHAVLLDIDHSPDNLLHPRHGAFYSAEGLRRLRDRLHPGGVFALWSDDPPEPGFLNRLADVFAAADAHVVPFANPYTGATASNTVYVATRPS